MSQAFARLLEVALAGTSRRAAPLASDLVPAVDNELSPEVRVLRLASYEGLRRLAGRASRADALPAPAAAAPADQRPEVSQAAARRLDDLLASHVELLSEWLSLVEASARRVSAASLPALLELVRTAEDRGLVELLIATGGERLPWLAAQHAPWAAALAAVPDSTARMPPPEHGERWAARTSRVVSFTEDAAGGARLDITLPSVVPADWLNDGLVEQPPRGSSGPPWLVQQLVARTPPSTWPPAFFPAAQASAWSRPLLAGLGQAAQAYADHTSCEVLLLMRARAADPLPLDAPALFTALPSAAAECVLQALIELGPAAFAGLPDLLPGPWSLDFSRRWLVAELPRLAARWQYGLLGLLDVAPRRLDPAVLPAAEQLLDRVTNDWSARALLRLIQTLDYRQAMAAELRT